MPTEGGSVTLRVAGGLELRDAILAAAFAAIDRHWVFVDRDDSAWTVVLSPRAGSSGPVDDVDRLANRFGEAVRSAAWRTALVERNRPTLDGVVAEAFAGLAGGSLSTLLSRSTGSEPDGPDAAAAGPGLVALAPQLEKRGVVAGQLEVSVRATDDGLRADRIMIRHAQDGVLEDVCAAFGLAIDGPVKRLADAAGQAPIAPIVGWDVTDRSVKLYANASSASVPARRELARALDLEGDLLPHLIGVNARADGKVVIKVYVQHADAIEAAEELPDGCRDLARRTVEAGLCAGAVVSYDTKGDGPITIDRPRGFFVALKPATGPQLDDTFGHLPFFSWPAIADAFPFEAAHPRSVGVACAEPTRFTVYAAPRWTDLAIEALEPAAAFRSGDVEVGIHVGSAGTVRAAYAVVSSLAVTYRIREGDPDERSLEPLLHWVMSRVADLAEGPREAIGPGLGDPPAPWRRTS